MATMVSVACRHAVKNLWMVTRLGRRIWLTIRRVLPLSLATALLLFLFRFDAPPYGDRAANLDRLLADRQFDFLGWWLGATIEKLVYELWLPQQGMSDQNQIAFVQSHMRAVAEFQRMEERIKVAYADPAIADPAAETESLRAERDARRGKLSIRQGIAEAILQEQVESVLREEGFVIGGQILPPLRFRFTELPDLLVVSRRDKIERIASRELTTGLTVDEQVRIEGQVDDRLDVSSLVTPIGGLGAYPTMLPETAALKWVLGVTAHEWVHNYLLFTLSPVGVDFLDSPEARVINETTAVIVQREIEQRVAEKYYPELTAALASDVSAAPASTEAATKNDPFDFRKEMRETRLRADDLLAEGKIEEAENYMEARRALFVQNGYLIRKLNQAYFAFYGAYNADPGGAPAAGKDPIGPAVQELRKLSPSLGAFLREIVTIKDFADLQRRLETNATGVPVR